MEIILFLILGFIFALFNSVIAINLIELYSFLVNKNYGETASKVIVGLLSMLILYFNLILIGNIYVLVSVLIVMALILGTPSIRRFLPRFNFE